MKKKEKTSFHDMKPDQLTKIILEAKDKLMQQSVDRFTKQTKNVREGRALRHKIAVAKTVLTMKELSHE